MKRSADVVVLRPEAGEWRCLILRAYRNWDFPKGLPEPEETELGAALRETEEETGLTRLQFRWGEQYCETEPYNRGSKVARYYLAVSARGDVVLPISPELGRPEHHEFRWVSFAEAEQHLPPRLLPVLEWARRMVGTKVARDPPEGASGPAPME